MKLKEKKWKIKNSFITVKDGNERLIIPETGK